MARLASRTDTKKTKRARTRCPQCLGQGTTTLDRDDPLCGVYACTCGAEFRANEAVAEFERLATAWRATAETWRARSASGRLGDRDLLQAALQGTSGAAATFAAMAAAWRAQAAAEANGVAD